MRWLSRHNNACFADAIMAVATLFVLHLFAPSRCIKTGARIGTGSTLPILGQRGGLFSSSYSILFLPSPLPLLLLLFQPFIKLYIPSRVTPPCCLDVVLLCRDCF